MKAGWKVSPLGDLLEVQNGYAFSSTDFSNEGGTPLIRIRDLKTGNGTAVSVVGDFDPSYLVRRGDLLIGMDGEFLCHEWKGTDALLNQRVCRLQGFSAALLPRFVLYGINKFLKEIEDVTAFTTVKHLSSKTIKAIRFPLPPLDEQKRIVVVLDEAFEGLDRARAYVEANLADAQELFKRSIEVEFEKLVRSQPRRTVDEIAVIKGGKRLPKGESLGVTSHVITRPLPEQVRPFFLPVLEGIDGRSALQH